MVKHSDSLRQIADMIDEDGGYIADIRIIFENELSSQKSISIEFDVRINCKDEVDKYINAFKGKK